MCIFRQIPLAWLQLKYERVRLWVAIAGISFAVVLMFMQLGFQAALFDSAVRLHICLKGDIFLLSARSTSLIGMKSFSERRLSQTLAIPEVEQIVPIYLGFAQLRNPAQPNYWRNIHVIGFDIRYPIFNLPDIETHQIQLKVPDVVLFDQASRHEFGPIAKYLQHHTHLTTEIDNITTNTRQIDLVGLFTLGTSFGIDGNLLTSHLNFLRIFSERNKGLIDVGVIQIQPAASAETIATKIRQQLPTDIKVFTQQQWIDFEKKYWTSSTAIGYIFSLGVGMGLVVGVIVVYQILYTDVSNHLKEYATLKAIGYQQRYFIGLIFQEALILAVMGYIPGFLISATLYHLAKKATFLPLAMTQIRSLFILCLTIIMCTIAGTIALRRLNDVDPADIF